MTKGNVNNWNQSENILPADHEQVLCIDVEGYFLLASHRRKRWFDICDDPIQIGIAFWMDLPEKPKQKAKQ